MGFEPLTPRCRAKGGQIRTQNQSRIGYGASPALWTAGRKLATAEAPGLKNGEICVTFEGDLVMVGFVSSLDLDSAQHFTHFASQSRPREGLLKQDTVGIQHTAVDICIARHV